MAYFNTVAIGTSAGGLKALTELLSHLPGDLPATVLVVQHLDPKHKSLIVELLQKHCRLKIKTAEDGEPAEPSVAYIAPPNKHLLLADGKISLSSSAFVHFSRPSIDLMFESVAASKEGNVIGVILTGSGSDGAMGIKAIKEKGGTTIAQDPDTAEHGSMPAAAIATGMVDFVLPLEGIAPAIITLINEGDGV
ncbi:chemotaxis protein CheB [Methanocella sp. MCL-LM]|uniref:chemotaxis protein CheB n=1 Tax=Methanocella sp. MCL-LM TaxID=3412035 RepID=UPI003C727D39